MYTSTVFAVIAAAACLVSAAPAITNDDTIACPVWSGASNRLTKGPDRSGITINQCCVPGERNGLNCCYTSGPSINSNQLACAEPWFSTAAGCKRLEGCVTKQAPQSSCADVPTMPRISRQYGDGKKSHKRDA